MVQIPPGYTQNEGDPGLWSPLRQRPRLVVDRPHLADALEFAEGASEEVIATAEEFVAEPGFQDIKAAIAAAGSDPIAAVHAMRDGGGLADLRAEFDQRLAEDEGLRARYQALQEALAEHRTAWEATIQKANLVGGDLDQIAEAAAAKGYDIALVTAAIPGAPGASIADHVEEIDQHLGRTIEAVRTPQPVAGLDTQVPSPEAEAAVRAPGESKDPAAKEKDLGLTRPTIARPRG